MQHWAQRGVQAALVTGGLWIVGAGIAAAGQTIDPSDVASSAMGEVNLGDHSTLIDSEDKHVTATKLRELPDSLRAPKQEIIPFHGPVEVLTTEPPAIPVDEAESLVLDASDHLMPATGLPTVPSFAPVSPRADIPDADLLTDTVMLPAVGSLDSADLALPERDLPTTQFDRIPGVTDAVEAFRGDLEAPAWASMERDLPTTQFDRIPGATDAVEGFTLQKPDAGSLSGNLPLDEMRAVGQYPVLANLPLNEFTTARDENDAAGLLSV